MMHGKRTLGTAVVVSLLFLALPARETQCQEPTESPRIIRSDTTRTYSLRDCLAYAMQHSRHVRDARLGLQVANKRVTEAWGEAWEECIGDQ